MAFSQQPNKALELLAHLVPSEVLGRARELAQQFEREAYVKEYIDQRGLWVALVGTVFAVTLFVVVLFLQSKLLQLIGPLASWLRLSVLGFSLLLWLGLTLAFMYFVLLSLQRAALETLARDEKSKHQTSEHGTER